jgi:hypothetical protein
MQAVGDEHDTLFSLVKPLGLGVLWIIVQLTPSQRSASCGPYSVEPTAMQVVAVGHETLLNWLSPPVGGFGVAWIDQPVPFHVSANVWWLPAASVYCPTAVQAVDDTHDTPFS